MSRKSGSIGRVARQNENYIKHASSESVGICEECGKPFKQIFRPSKGADGAGEYTHFNTCGSCRTAAASGIKKVTIPYTPHPAQQKILDSNVRFKIMRCGNRFGKDLHAIGEGVMKFLEMLNEERSIDVNPPVLWWIIAPNMRLARQNWRDLKKLLPKELVFNISLSNLTIETINGGIIEVHSADDPETLVGVGLDIVTITEAARIRELDIVWANLRQRLDSEGRGPNGTGGIAIINSTPKGRTYFYKLCQMGDKNSPLYSPSYETFHFTTWDNPGMAKKRYTIVGHDAMGNPITFEDEIKKGMTEARYRQDYCVVPYTRIYGKTLKRADEIEEGDLVYSHSGKLRKVNKVMIRHYEGNLICIKSYKGDGCLKITPEHSVLSYHSVMSKRCLEKFEPKWIQAKDLNVNDFILYPLNNEEISESGIQSIKLSDYANENFIETEAGEIYYKPKWTTQKPILRAKPKKVIYNTIPLNKDVLRLIGLWLAEGSVNSGNTPTWAFSKKEMHFCEEIKSTLEKWFGLNNVRIYDGTRCLCVKTTNLFLSCFLSCICGKGSNHKKLDDLIMNLSNKQIAWFLSGYFDGDGHAGKDRANFVTSSIELSKQIRYLLKRIGVENGIHIVRRKGNKICGKDVASKECYQIQIFGEELAKLYKLLDVNINVQKPKWNQTFEVNGYKWVRIMDISKERYKGNVYNYEIDIDNTYVTENGIVHNCAEFMMEINAVFPYYERIMIRPPIDKRKEDEIASFWNDWESVDPFETYTIGYDPASKGDGHPVVIRNSKGRVVKIDLMTRLGWDAQWDKVAMYSRLYNNAVVNFGQTGCGETIPSQLLKRGLIINPLNEQGGNKLKLVEDFALVVEQQWCEIPWSDEIERQLQDYVSVERDGKSTQYHNMTDSNHDDIISALYFCFSGFEIIVETSTAVGCGYVAGINKAG